VALVTPLRDGLNLVAKEFVVAQEPTQPGVLVLSKFAGAAAELVDAVISNPYHPEGLAADIDRALRMTTSERKERHEKMLAALAGKTPQGWATAFLDRLLSTVRSVA
jgi:trehalose 6-phosphate synthase